MNQSNASAKIKKMSITAMFCAVAFILTYIKLPVTFLSLEIKDSMIVLCTLLFGPLSGLVIAVIVPFLEFITHSTTGVYGLIMNILSSVTFSMVTGFIYKYKKSFYGAIAGLAAGVFSVTAVMLLANLLVTPYYMGVSAQDVAAMIPKLLLPFNLIKALLNGSIVLLMYKPFSNLLKRGGFIPGGASVSGVSQNRLRSLLVTVVAIMLIVGSLAVILFVLQ